ncbi:MAG: hypothetical protein methR_P2556 [Methyloprofundus sp.]|nr:MAG: hypothetical protein methR_P2556 [Methyloprofundus sp.]
MNPHVVGVEVKQEYILKLAFANKEVRLFDASSFLDKGTFNELKDINYFKQVKVAFGAIEWRHEQGFSKDTLYLLSTPLES